MTIINGWMDSEIMNAVAIDLKETLKETLKEDFGK
jgi:hypothetical protein